MMLVEMTSTPSTALPVSEFRQHLRLGTGFGEDSLQDPILETLLKSAISAIEGRTGKALFSRRFSWSLTGFRDPGAQRLPVAPVSAIHLMRLVSFGGADQIVDPTSYRLIRDTHGPEIAATGLALPMVPTAGTVEIEFEAGFATDWVGIPPDLVHAVMLLAGHYYEHRYDVVDDRTSRIPFGVAALIERYRGPRLGRGGLA